MNALSQLVSKLSRGVPLNADDIVAMLLVITMVASTTHLLTMLSTQWGDRNTALKSLLASILVHGVCFLGLEVYGPASEIRERHPAPPPPPPETIAEVLLESDQDIRLPESGNVPIADRPVSADIDFARLDLTSPEITPAETPERSIDKLESLTTRLNDVTQFEKRELTELAVPTDSGELGALQVAAEDMASEIKTTYERSAADVFAPELSRTRPQDGRPEQLPRNSDPSRRMTAPELEFEAPRQDAVMSLATVDDARITLPPVDSTTRDSISSRRAPQQSDSAVDGSAMLSDRSDPKIASAVTFQSRLPRPSQASPDRTPAERPSRSVPDRARTPVPLSRAYDDVRVGDVAPNFTESLESAAALTEADFPVIRRRDNPPVAYQLRNVAARRDTALKYGGTRESENAVERSLKWLASVQSEDGRWSAKAHEAGQVGIDEFGVDRQFAGREADTGLTALVTLAFLGAGYTHEQGKYALQVDHALDWLIQQQGSDGNLFGNAEHFARMYCHAMATYALAEAYGMQDGPLLVPIVDPGVVRLPGDLTMIAAGISGLGCTSQVALCLISSSPRMRVLESEHLTVSLRRVDDLRLRSALSRAITFTIGRQDPRSGGWRYRPLQEGDVSMFGWQMMALKSAEIAGVFIPSRVRQRMEDFLNSVRQGQHGGLFGYRRNVVIDGQDSEPVTPTMTAEALFCRQMLGHPLDSPAMRESVDYLMQHKPRLAEINYYYWYYGTLALYQNGGQPWQEWNAVVRELLISEQVRNGVNAGSWNPNDEWGRYGGRLYSTALATLTLEVYYRFLPLYKMNNQREIEIRLR